MDNEIAPAEVRFFELMKRVRKIGLDSTSIEEGAESPAQMSLLDWIEANPGSGVQEIAGGLGLTAPTVSIGVRKMEQKGYVERQSNPLDGRSVRFFLTHEGESVQNRFQKEHLNRFRVLLAGLTNQEQETLLELLARALQTT